MSSFWSKYLDVLFLHLHIFFTKQRDILLLYWKHLQIITTSFPCIYTFGQSQSQVFGQWQLFPAFLQDRCYLLLGLLNINYATLRSNFNQINNGNVIELEQRLILAHIFTFFRFYLFLPFNVFLGFSSAVAVDVPENNLFFSIHRIQSNYLIFLLIYPARKKAKQMKRQSEECDFL